MPCYDNRVAYGMSHEESIRKYGIDLCSVELASKAACECGRLVQRMGAANQLSVETINWLIAHFKMDAEADKEL